ncbi:hypothetical protein [Streptomyces nitrosporeus]|uniref:hypothetical protein n=1 Tax=Streptomyces nitrosporeus TaxID=28894 RepID=UPI0039A0DBFF
MVQKPQSDAEGKERRIDLSLPQVAGSALAAVAAAVMASQLGVYGTIAGAGVMSVVATCGGSVFQHFFRRTGEQIREVTVHVKHPGGRQVTVRTREPASASPPRDDDAATTALRTVRPERDRTGTTADDPERTRPLKAADPERTQLLGAVDPDRTRLLGAVDPERTQLLGAVRPDGTRPPGSTAGAVPGAFGETDDEYSEARTHGTRVRGWKRPLLAAAAVFAVAMGGITVYELATGNDLSGGGGTTVGSVVRGGGGHGTTDPAPADDGTERQDDGGPDDGAPDRGTPAPSGTGSDGDRNTEPGTDPGTGAPSTTGPEPAPSATGGTTPPAPTGSAAPESSAPAAPEPTASGDAPAEDAPAGGAPPDTGR